jgi:hypothetical protein
MRAMRGDGKMKDLIYCKVEKKKINPQYYPCENSFHCDSCPKSKPKRKTKKKKLILVRRSCPSIPFYSNDDGGTLETYAYKENGEWHHFLVKDSYVLKMAISHYLSHTKEPMSKGMEAFWTQIERFCKWTQGNWSCLTEEERDLLAKAKDGSLEAIQKLVVANPKMVHIPFVANVFENLIRDYKYNRDTKKNLKGIKKEWLGFLPLRESNKDPIPDYALSEFLKGVMDRNRITKEKASEILLKKFPFLTKSKLGKLRINSDPGRPFKKI